jgi:hypothetical protein
MKLILILAVVAVVAVAVWFVGVEALYFFKALSMDHQVANQLLTQAVTQ